MKDELKKIIDISRDIGQCPDLVQGAGGNFSIKIDDRKMLIKASGFRFLEVLENNGLVAVDYDKLSKYYNTQDFSDVFEPDSADFIDSCILGKIGSGNIKPSKETGFHALLGKYVIHTHSVYANIITCALDGENLFKKIFQDSGIDIIWLPYSNPGLHLTLCVKEAIDRHKNKYNKIPEVILIQNHGLIVSGNNLKHVFDLHNEIQIFIKQYLNFKKVFPKNKKDKINFLKKFIKNNGDLIENFSKNILFPDQIVFCDNINDKISIDESAGNINYKINKKEERAIEENLIAWLYIVDCAKDCGLVLNPLSQKDLDYINNMESEKYRQKLIKR